MGEFGNKFRKTRENKNLSLDDVSNVTKISARMLKAIEEENFDLLPGGVFNKGFIRAYAKHLGLNDEEAVSDYLACLRQAQIEAQQAWEPARPDPARGAAPNKLGAASVSKTTPKSQAPVQVEELPDLQLPRAEDVRPPRKHLQERSGIPRLLIAVVVLLIAAGIFLWTRHSRSERAARIAASAPSPTSSAAPVPAPPVAAPQISNPQTLAASPVAALPHATPSAKTSQPVSPAASGTRPTLSAPTTAAETQNAGPAIPPTAQSSRKKSSENSTGSLTLIIRATENSWISVTADGQLVTQETLIAPAATSVHASREIVARIGNAAGVTFLWNGQEISAQGTEAEVKTFVFDAAGMRVLSPTQPPAQNP